MGSDCVRESRHLDRSDDPVQPIPDTRHNQRTGNRQPTGRLRLPRSPRTRSRNAELLTASLPGGTFHSRFDCVCHPRKVPAVKRQRLSRRSVILAAACLVSRLVPPDITRGIWIALIWACPAAIHPVLSNEPQDGADRPLLSRADPGRLQKLDGSQVFEVLGSFSAIVFVEGGGKLQHHDLLKGKPFLMVSSNAKSQPRSTSLWR